jgi:hypothetical protein
MENVSFNQKKKKKTFLIPKKIEFQYINFSKDKTWISKNN